MFGSYRFMLALAVLVSHTQGPFWLGNYAVHGFFTLSGFLMTLIVHEHYGHSMAGIKAYALNRFLRIYPLYFVVLALAYISKELIAYDSEYSAGEICSNIMLIGLNDSNNRIIEPAWSLAIEVPFYAFIPLLVIKKKYSVGLWLIGSLAYYINIIMNDPAFNDLYYTIASGSLPFSLGSTMYYIHKRFSLNSGAIKIAIITLYIGNLLAGKYIFNYQYIYSFNLYFNILVCPLVVWVFMNVKNMYFHKLDKYLGNLSYPIFLIHYPLLLVAISHFKGTNKYYLTITIIILSVFLSHFLSKFDHIFQKYKAPRLIH